MTQNENNKLKTKFINFLIRSSKNINIIISEFIWKVNHHFIRLPELAAIFVQSALINDELVILLFIIVTWSGKSLHPA